MVKTGLMREKIIVFIAKTKTKIFKQNFTLPTPLFLQRQLVSSWVEYFWLLSPPLAAQGDGVWKTEASRWQLLSAASSSSSSHISPVPAWGPSHRTQSFGIRLFLMDFPQTENLPGKAHLLWHGVIHGLIVDICSTLFLSMGCMKNLFWCLQHLLLLLWSSCSHCCFSLSSVASSSVWGFFPF